MATQTIRINMKDIDASVVDRAAGILRAGGLVAFPTETVYGLGASALDCAAVARIYAAKGRPPINPIIVHVADAKAAHALVREWPETAATLAAAFWPGPLTLVLPKQANIPEIVTASGATVGVRVPAHPVSLMLLRAVGIPIAAPSANLSTAVSATRVEHIPPGLREHIDLILDAGPTSGGLESTVLDLTSSPARILRPGLVTPAEIEAVIGPIARSPGKSGAVPVPPLASPGLLERHYAPRAPLACVAGDGREEVLSMVVRGRGVGWLHFYGVAPIDDARVIAIPMAAAPGPYAARLYAALHEFDGAGVDAIIVAAPPDSEEWLAVRDRLRRAASNEYGTGRLP